MNSSPSSILTGPSTYAWRPQNSTTTPPSWCPLTKVGGVMVEEVMVGEVMVGQVMVVEVMVGEVLVG